MAKSTSTRRFDPTEMYVSTEARPGWMTAESRLPSVGEEVYCAGGAGKVVAVRGRTGDGSRLLEIQLAERDAKPFFAAASNVLVAPRG